MLLSHWVDSFGLLCVVELHSLHVVLRETRKEVSTRESYRGILLDKLNGGMLDTVALMSVVLVESVLFVGELFVRLVRVNAKQSTREG